MSNIQEWEVEWKVSGHYHKKVFFTYKEAKEYLIETVETFGKNVYLEITMKKGAIIWKNN